MKSSFLFLLCTAFLLMGSLTAHAENFPQEEPFNYMIAFSAGGASDIYARAQQPYLEKELRQKVLINYKVGAGGSVAWAELAKSKPSGYNAVGFNIPHIILQPLQRKNAGYKTEDLKPVMIFMNTPCVLAGRADSPYKTLDDLIRAQKQKPGSIIIGGVGNATAGHIACVMFNKLTGLKFAYIPFPGTADLPIALLGKHVTAIMAFTDGATQYAKDMRVLAVASEKRAPHVDAPTFRELGYDIVEGSLRGIAVPRETPDEYVETLYNIFATINGNPEFVRKVESMGYTVMDMNPQQSREYINMRVKDYTALLEELSK